MTGLRSYQLLSSIFSVAIFAAAGCGGPTQQVTTFNVNGTVTLGDAPLDEGTVNFDNDTDGFAGSAKILPGGKFAMTVPGGTYTVTVTPPVVEIDQGPESPPSEGYKPDSRIPEKYWEAIESPLVAQVSADSTTFEFALEP